MTQTIRSVYLVLCCLSAGGGDGAREVAVESLVSSTVDGLPEPLPPSANASPLMLPTHHYVTIAPSVEPYRHLTAPIAHEDWSSQVV
ncbi:unnamed protein product [Leptosia nina]|uniref:Secreted protein n=1 Tax=Leptosia nina TaxID=320188 RepID=A0AAV1J7J2_9NEOP